MKAISLWQPWASAIVLGFKCIETRHWPTTYRGPLVIHAAKRMTRAEKEFISEARACGYGIPFVLPLGALIGVAQLYDCRRVEQVRDEIGNVEHFFGGYTQGRFAWMLGEVRRFAVPIPYRGEQGLFNVPDALLRASSKGHGDTP